MSTQVNTKNDQSETLEVLNTEFPTHKFDTSNFPSNYQLIKINGNYVLQTNGCLQKETDAEEKPWKTISGLIFCVGLARDRSGNQWSTVFKFIDRDGETKQYTIPQSSLITTGNIATDVIKELSDAGLFIVNTPEAKRSITSYLSHENLSRYRLTSVTGWHEDDLEQRSFVLPDTKIIGEGNFLLQEAQPFDSPKGTLEEWKDNISIPSMHNSRLIFTISLGLATPILEPLGQKESGGFHLVGSSSIGKSVAAQVCESVWSPRIPTWDGTKNGIEGMAANRSDMGLVLDEIGQADSSRLAECIYMLGNGEGKARSTISGRNRVTKAWRLLWLSTGEAGLSSVLTEAGRSTKVGQEVRLAEIEADVGGGMGLFEKLPDGINASKNFAETLSNKAKTEFYGTAGPDFIEYLLANLEESKLSYEVIHREFQDKFLDDSSSGQIARVARRFALVAAAGELATKAGITGWLEGHAMWAAGECFSSWRKNWSSTGENRETIKALTTVQSYITLNLNRFVPYSGAQSTNRTHDHIGYSAMGRELPNADDDGKYYIIPTSDFNNVVCKNVRARDVTSILKKRNLLLLDTEGKCSISLRPKSQVQQRCVVISAKIFDDPLLYSDAA